VVDSALAGITRKQIQAMDTELEDYMRKNKQLALDIAQMQLKHKALQSEMKSQRKKLTLMDQFVRRNRCPNLKNA